MIFVLVKIPLWRPNASKAKIYQHDVYCASHLITITIIIIIGKRREWYLGSRDWELPSLVFLLTRSDSHWSWTWWWWGWWEYYGFWELVGNGDNYHQWHNDKDQSTVIAHDPQLMMFWGVCKCPGISLLSISLKIFCMIATFGWHLPFKDDPCLQSGFEPGKKIKIKWPRALDKRGINLPSSFGQGSRGEAPR